jgi:hypothetical protein
MHGGGRSKKRQPAAPRRTLLCPPLILAMPRKSGPAKPVPANFDKLLSQVRPLCLHGGGVPPAGVPCVPLAFPRRATRRWW